MSDKKKNLLRVNRYNEREKIREREGIIPLQKKNCIKFIQTKLKLKGFGIITDVLDPAEQGIFMSLLYHEIGLRGTSTKENKGFISEIVNLNLDTEEYGEPFTTIVKKVEGLVREIGDIPEDRTWSDVSVYWRKKLDEKPEFQPFTELPHANGRTTQNNIHFLLFCNPRLSPPVLVHSQFGTEDTMDLLKHPSTLRLNAVGGDSIPGGSVMVHTPDLIHAFTQQKASEEVMVLSFRVNENPSLIRMSPYNAMPHAMEKAVGSKEDGSVMGEEIEAECCDFIEGYSKIQIWGREEVFELMGWSKDRYIKAIKARENIGGHMF